jgi:sigma-E factor negative regulatory protein RseA
MSDTVRESLSALMDGEASELELRRILNADQQAIRSEWADLHRGQQLLKNESSPFLGWDISSRVLARWVATCLVAHRRWWPTTMV